MSTKTVKMEGWQPQHSPVSRDEEKQNVSYWTSNAKMRAFYRVPLSLVEWHNLKDDFPKVEASS